MKRARLRVGVLAFAAAIDLLAVTLTLREHARIARRAWWR